MENTETTALMAQAESLGGPQVSGTVTMSLMEIDKLRHDYVNAVKAYKNLALHVKEVRIVLVNGDGSNNKFVKDKNKREVISYKNLDEFRSLISQEEQEKVQQQFKELHSRLEHSQKQTLDALAGQNDLKASMNKISADHNEQKKELKRKIEELENALVEKNEEVRKCYELIDETTKQANEYISKNERLTAQVANLRGELRERPWWKFW